jgi:hypothetical protein
MAGPRKKTRKKATIARKPAPKVAEKERDEGIHPIRVETPISRDMNVQSAMDAIKKQSNEGLVELEDWHEYEMNQSGLPMGLPEEINDKPVKYLRLTLDDYLKDRRRRYMIPVRDTDPRFDSVPRIDFRDGMMITGDLLVFAMYLDTYEKIIRAEQERLYQLNASMCPRHLAAQAKEDGKRDSSGKLDAGIVESKTLESFEHVSDSPNLTELQEMAEANRDGGLVAAN